MSNGPRECMREHPGERVNERVNRFPALQAGLGKRVGLRPANLANSWHFQISSIDIDFHQSTAMRPKIPIFAR